MAIFTVPIVRVEVARAIDAYLEGEAGSGPRVAYPSVQPKLVKVAASSKREAFNLALRSNPGWAVHPSNIMKARDA